MKICEGNVQDYFQYRPLDFNFAKSFSDSESFPLFAVRKIHDGKPILRITIFVSSRKWREQIAFYSRLCDASTTLVRDDFCLINLKNTLSKKVKMQFGLKRLPEGLRPKQLVSTFLEFEIRQYDTVALTPHELEPMSDLRMRTRDHDGSTIILIVPNKKVKSEIEFKQSLFKMSASCTSRSLSPHKNKHKSNKNENLKTSVYLSKTRTILSLNNQSLETKLIMSQSSEAFKENCKIKRKNNSFEKKKSVDFSKLNSSLSSKSRLLSVASKNNEECQNTQDKSRQINDYEKNENKLSIRERIAKFESPVNSSSKTLSTNSSIIREKNVKLLDHFTETLNISNEKFTYPKLPERMPLIVDCSYKSFKNNGNNIHLQKRPVSAVPCNFHFKKSSELKKISNAEVNKKYNVLESKIKEGFYV